VLCGYEEGASLRDGAEPRILRAIVGQSVRMIAKKNWREPLDAVMRFAGGERWRPWLLYD
jgi:hypothetical protein